MLDPADSDRGGLASGRYCLGAWRRFARWDLAPRPLRRLPPTTTTWKRLAALAALVAVCCAREAGRDSLRGAGAAAELTGGCATGMAAAAGPRLPALGPGDGRRQQGDRRPRRRDPRGPRAEDSSAAASPSALARRSWPPGGARPNRSGRPRRRPVCPPARRARRGDDRFVSAAVVWGRSLAAAAPSRGPLRPAAARQHGPRRDAEHRVDAETRPAMNARRAPRR